MSGSSGSYYRETTSRSASVLGGDENARREREVHLRSFASRAAAEPVRERAKAATPVDAIPVNRSLARNTITVPAAEAKEVHVILVDNSGSNKQIAESLRRASGYIHANASVIAGDASIAFQFFSDHCDGSRLIQEADYVMPGTEGEEILRASIANIYNARGGDEPEAIECALYRAAVDYRFDERIPRDHRFLYLVTDQVAHNMSTDRDDGCPLQRDWKKSLKQAHETYGSFQFIASGSDPAIFQLQRQFIAPDRQQFDLMDLATGQLTHEERCRLIPNALLFLMARNRGKQAVQLFTLTVVEKWLAEPQYGSDTLRRAKKQIQDFCMYLDWDRADVEDLLQRAFAGTEEHG
jgi:hypothetical protein